MTTSRFVTIGVMGALALAAVGCMADDDPPVGEPAAEESEAAAADDALAMDCSGAAALGGDRAETSCELGVPVDLDGVPADEREGDGETSELVARTCNTYYGGCTGIWYGCSRAAGEGWEVTACGSFLYAWLTICDGAPSAWGTGFCIF